MGSMVTNPRVTGYRKVKGCAVVDPKFREPFSDRLAVRLRVVPLLIPKGRLQVMFEVDGHV